MKTTFSILTLFLLSFFLARGTAIFVTKKAISNEWAGELGTTVAQKQPSAEIPFVVSKTLRTFEDSKDYCLNAHNGEMFSVESLSEMGDFSPFINLVVWTDSLDVPKHWASVAFFYNKSNLIQFIQKDEMKHGVVCRPKMLARSGL